MQEIMRTILGGSPNRSSAIIKASTLIYKNRRLGAKFKLRESLNLIKKKCSVKTGLMKRFLTGTWPSLNMKQVSRAKLTRSKNFKIANKKLNK